MDLDGGGGAAVLVPDGIDGMGGCPFALPGGGGGGPCLDCGFAVTAGGILGNGLDDGPDGGTGRGREFSDADGLFAIGGGVGRGLELPVGGWGREVLELFGEGGLKPGGFIAEPLGPPFPPDLSLGIPPANRPPSPPEGAPIALPPPPPPMLPPLELGLTAPKDGALRSFVSVFLSLAPL